MDKELALARLNLLLKTQWAEYRHRMNYLERRLRWGWMLPRWMMRGRR